MTDERKPKAGSGDSTQIEEEMYGLETSDGRGGMAFHQIVTPLFHIGRRDDCNLVVWEDSKVSRRHAIIHRQGEQFMLEDNGSANGTYLNGERVEGTVNLRPGDRIHIGAGIYMFRKLG